MRKPRTTTIKFEDLPKTRIPILDYCRRLIEQGENPNSRLEIYRNNLEPDIVCPNIGRAAKLTVREDSEKGPYFAKYRPFIPFK